MQMVPNMMVTLKMIKEMGLESCILQMGALFTVVNGKMARSSLNAKDNLKDQGKLQVMVDKATEKDWEISLPSLHMHLK